MFKIGDSVKTINPKIAKSLNANNSNIFVIQYFVDNGRRAYLTAENSWMIEEVAVLKLID